MAVFRRPRTFTERRAACALSSDRELQVLRMRARRTSEEVLPSEYSDLQPGWQRSWKRFRKTRYK